MERMAFYKMRDAMYARIVMTNETKGVDYAGETDALANFKDAAIALGMTPFQIWAVYHHKHQSAIDQFIKRGRVESEPIEDRIMDAILYLFLLLGLVEDAKTEEKECNPPVSSIDLGPPSAWHPDGPSG